MQYIDTSITALLIHGFLFLLLGSVIITDLKWQSIYNVQTYTAALAGLTLNLLGGGWIGLLESSIGLVVGCALLLVFYISGGFGAGDVKMLAAIGALKGMTFVLWSMAFAALVGGIMAFAVMIWKGVFWGTIQKSFYLMRHPIRGPKEFSETPQIYLPYGVAISIGSFWALLAL